MRYIFSYALCVCVFVLVYIMHIPVHFFVCIVCVYTYTHTHTHTQYIRKYARTQCIPKKIYACKVYTYIWHGMQYVSSCSIYLYIKQTRRQCACAVACVLSSIYVRMHPNVCLSVCLSVCLYNLGRGGPLPPRWEICSRVSVAYLVRQGHTLASEQQISTKSNIISRQRGSSRIRLFLR